MTESKFIRRFNISIDDRKLSIIVFSLFFSWLLSFPFEGRILYELADHHNISIHSFVFGTIAAHFAGLIFAGFFVKNMLMAKRFILFSIAFCVVISGLFFLPPSLLWKTGLLAASFLLGCCVASWGFYFKSSTPKKERIKTMADALIFSNILMIFLNVTAIHISPLIGLGISMIMLIMAFLFALRFPHIETDYPTSEKSVEIAFKSGPIVFLCLFIVTITINSGLMYQVQGPAFAHLEWLTSWYWSIPYIVALYIMRNLPRKTNRAYILYVAIAMIGFSFISFLILDRSWASYLVVNTLMLGACGVYDLFWWSILGEMLDFYKNPVKVMGIGLSANVLGVFIGGLIGIAVSSGYTASYHPTLIALGVVCITLVMLPPLHNRLVTVLKDHAFLNAVAEIAPQEQTKLIRDFSVLEKLTERESEVVALLLKGNTYRMIAGELRLSENTVKTHIKNIYSKVGVQSKTELINLLIEI